jgi:hypothetical protein
MTLSTTPERLRYFPPQGTSIILAEPPSSLFAGMVGWRFEVRRLPQFGAQARLRADYRHTESAILEVVVHATDARYFTTDPRGGR